MQKPVAKYSWWSREQRPFTLAELVVDGIVHVLGLVVAIAAWSNRASKRFMGETGHRL